MNFGKISTFTSGVLALASQKDNDLEIDFIQPAKKNNFENIIVLRNLSDATNYDHLLSTVSNMGFEVIISDCISEFIAAKASNNGILTIEVSNHFLQKIVRLSKKLPAKIFVDLKGPEVMIVNSGEKEFFKMSLRLDGSILFFKNSNSSFSLKFNRRFRNLNEVGMIFLSSHLVSLLIWADKYFLY